MAGPWKWYIMKKTKEIIIAIATLIAMTMIIFIAVNSMPKVHIPYYTEEPKTWITNEKDYELSNKTIIDIEKMTKGDSNIDETHQRYTVEGDIKSFYYHAYYKGNSFKTEYLDPIFYNISYGKPIDEVKILRAGYTLMKISPEIQPNDNIIEGIIVAREENQKIVFYIFVDEDWKNKIPFTNIIWGDDLNNKETLNIRGFDFSNNENGVYIEKIENEVNWHNLYPKKGGIIVGEMTINDVVEDNIKDKTFMYIR